MLTNKDSVTRVYYGDLYRVRMVTTCQEDALLLMLSTILRARIDICGWWSRYGSEESLK